MQETPLSSCVFTPRSAQLIGPAFGIGFRVIASSLMVILTVWGIRVLMDPALGPFDRNIVGGALLAYGLLLYMWWTMMRSTTTLTDSMLSQTWFWSKSVPLAQISYAKFLRLRGLEWLVAPRIYVRTGPGPFVSFFAASPEMWEEFEAMARELGH